ncbi:MAG: hypothetical protein M1817_003843 [Caeruleum heppii]|nr:MAG: hypothetical protein M1817_003843 [Caeruleum heppii]
MRKPIVLAAVLLGSVGSATSDYQQYGSKSMTFITSTSTCTITKTVSSVVATATYTNYPTTSTSTTPPPPPPPPSTSSNSTTYSPTYISMNTSTAIYKPSSGTTLPTTRNGTAVSPGVPTAVATGPAPAVTTAGAGALGEQSKWGVALAAGAMALFAAAL